MNINKLIVFILTLVLLNFNNVLSEEKVKLDDEELPAIDPFQGNAAVGQNQNSIDTDTNDQNSEAGILNGMRLVGTIIGKSKKFAILSRPDGNVFKFEEDQKLNSKCDVSNNNAFRKETRTCPDPTDRSWEQVSAKNR